MKKEIITVSDVIRVFYPNIMVLLNAFKCLGNKLYLFKSICKMVS